jgi:tryptophan 2,3-dioxygenase
MLFIIIHQVYELWFKQILHELDSIITMFDRNFVDERNIGVAVSRIDRIIEIEKLLIDQIKVLETMTPLDFLDFRTLLTGASGFQSAQFRLIENKLGLRPEARLCYANKPYAAELCPHERSAVAAAEQGPTLFSVVERWLERTPFLSFGSFDFADAFRAAHARMITAEKAAIDVTTSITDEDKRLRYQMLDQSKRYVDSMLDAESYGQLQANSGPRFSHGAFLAILFINLYRDQPILHEPFRFLSSLLEFDEYLNIWRYRHSLMVLRMIGAKMGTGGSAGHDYLRQTVDKHKVFGDLFTISTMLIPRSELPPLPETLARELSFSFSSK